MTKTVKKQSQSVRIKTLLSDILLHSLSRSLLVVILLLILLFCSLTAAQAHPGTILFKSAIEEKESKQLINSMKEPFDYPKLITVDDQKPSELQGWHESQLRKSSDISCSYNCKVLA